MSEAWDELGGKRGGYAQSTPGHLHRFDPLSGWCGCGRRDDGALAEGSPAAQGANA